MYTLWVVIFIFVICFFIWKTTRRPKKFPPGPPYDPVVGNLRYVLKRTSKLGSVTLVMEELVKSYGKIVGLQVGTSKIILVADQSLVREICARDEFNGRPAGFLWRLRARGAPRGIAFVNGQLWTEQRRFCVHQLKQFGVGKNFMEQRIIEEANAFVEFVMTKRENPVTMDKFFNVFVLNIIWMFVANKRFEPDDEEVKRIFRIIEENFTLTDMSGGLLNQVPFLRHILPNKTGYNQVTKNYITLYEFIEKCILEHRKTKYEGLERDLIDVYLNEIEKGEDPFFTDDQLRVVCLDFLQSGSETTSNSLSFLILYMVQNESVQKKVQKEIDDIIGNDQPTMNHKINCNYVNSVIMESLRKTSVAPMGVARVVLKDTELDGYSIPEGSTILLMMRYINNNGKIWKNPDSFIPERFIDENNNEVETFGYGKRRCIGEAMARTSLFIFFVTIFQRFDVLPYPEGNIPTVEISSGTSLSLKPFQVIFKERKK